MGALKLVAWNMGSGAECGMSDTKLDYGAMMERARHGVARQALELVRDQGLPGGSA